MFQLGWHGLGCRHLQGESLQHFSNSGARLVLNPLLFQALHFLNPLLFQALHFLNPLLFQALHFLFTLNPPLFCDLLLHHQKHLLGLALLVVVVVVDEKSFLSFD